MMTPLYFGEVDGVYERIHRSNNRAFHSADSRERYLPYGYYGHTSRHDSRSEPDEYPPMRAMDEESEETAAVEPRPRKRISVACRRCRRRKIKCSGDNGDGTGCQACRSAGADGGECAFIRVGAFDRSELPSKLRETKIQSSIEINPVVSHNSSSSYHLEIPSNCSSRYADSHHLSHRPSLPTLQTRGSLASEHDPAYDYSPIESYTYASSLAPRQDSSANAQHFADHRTWSSSGSISAPAATMYYDNTPMYSFSSLQGPSFPLGPQHPTRLPSVTGESFTPLNMSRLNSSLPTQTMQERRLPAPPFFPAPYAVSASAAHQGSFPQIRPLGSYSEPKMPMNGISGRQSMSWSTDNSSYGSRLGSMSSYLAPIALPMSSGESNQRMTTAGFEYQLPLTESRKSNSPDISPTSGPAVTDNGPINCSVASMLPTFNANNLMSSASGASAYGIPSMCTKNRVKFQRETHPAFHRGAEASERQTRDANDHHSGYQIPLREPQAHHAANVESLHHQASYEDQRASTVHRMSLSNLNTDF